MVSEKRIWILIPLVSFALVAWAPSTKHLNQIKTQSRLERSTSLQGNHPVCGVPTLINQGQWIGDHSQSLPLDRIQLQTKGVFTDTVGQIISFWVWDFYKKEYHSITARLERKGLHCYIYVDTLETVSEGSLADIVEEFDNHIYPTITQYFGSEWKPGIDNDTLITLLLYDIRDDKYYNPLVNYYIAGYFHPKDEYPVSSNPKSNEREMLYLDLNPGDPGGDPFYGILAHELQHLIHWNHDPNEETWVNEGCSEYAMFLIGHYQHEIISIGLFLSDPDNSLTTWEGRLEDYGQVFLWTLYLSEHYGGPDLIRNLVAEPANGIEGINNALGTSGYPNTNFTTIFSDWVIANYLDDPTLEDGEYGYQGIDLPQITPSALHLFYPVPVTQATVSGWAADYIEFRQGQSLTINFDGEATAPYGVRVIKMGQEVAVQGLELDENRDGTITIPEFGDLYQKVILVPTLQFSLPQAIYRYSAEATGQVSAIEIAYDDGYPYYYWEFDKGDTVAVVFDGVDNTGLDSVRLMFYSPGSIEFHIWERAPQAVIGKDLIRPFRVEVNEITASQQEVNWQVIDLRDHYFDSSQDFVLGYVLTSDAPDPKIISDSLESEPHHSYVYTRHPEHGPGWYYTRGDFMLRAYLSNWINDFTTPEITVGVLQNPVFTENLDIYAISTKPLNPESVTGEFILNGEVDNLTMTPHDSVNTIFVDDSYTLSASGTATVIVRGTHRRGDIVGSDTLLLNVQLISYTQGGSLISAAGDVSLRLPPHSLTRDTYLTLIPGEDNLEAIGLSGTDSPDTLAISQVYTLGPLGLRLNSPAQLSFRYDRSTLLERGLDEEKLTIATLRDGRWVSLGGRVDPERNSVWTEIGDLGVFQLRYDPDKKCNYNPSIPLSYELHQNYPNPFNSQTTISYSLKTRGMTSIVIYNLLGQRVRALVNEVQDRGRYSIRWDGSDETGQRVPSGLYLCRLRSGDFSASKKIILLK